MNQFISPKEVKEKLDNNKSVVILDVRETDEYESWHIKNSINVPLTKLPSELKNISKNNEIVTVCQHGIRSERARQMLVNLGYNAKTMEGGMVMWNSVYDIVNITVLNKNVKVLQLRRIGKGCLSYIIINEKNAIVIDPTIDVNVYINVANEKNAKIIGVLDTHLHADHVSGGKELATLTKSKYLISNKDGSINFNNINIKVIKAPGHTPESVIYLFEDLAFTGDTLFIESVGRPDLGQEVKGNASILWETIHKKLLNLDENVKILPGHYSEEVVLEKNKVIIKSIKEIKKLKALQMNKDEFVNWVVKNSNPKPGNFEIIKKINQGFIYINEKDELRDLEAGPNRCAVS